MSRESVIEMRRRLFSNAPKILTCRVCGLRFANPILEGSSIVGGCPTCREKIIGKKMVSKKKPKVDDTVEVEQPVITSDSNQSAVEPIYLIHFRRYD